MVGIKMHSLSHHGTGLMTKAHVYSNTSLYYLCPECSPSCLSMWDKDQFEPMVGFLSPASEATSMLLPVNWWGRCFSLNDACVVQHCFLTLSALRLTHTVPTSSDHLLVQFCFSQGKKQGDEQSPHLAGACNWKIPLWTAKNGLWASSKNVLQIQQFVTISEQDCCQLPVILFHTESSPGASPLAKVWDPAKYQIPLLHIIVLAMLSQKLPVYM